MWPTQIDMDAKSQIKGTPGRSAFRPKQRHQCENVLFVLRNSWRGEELPLWPREISFAMFFETLSEFDFSGIKLRVLWLFKHSKLREKEETAYFKYYFHLLL